MTERGDDSEVGTVNSITFWLPNLPPSVNEIYAPGRSLYSSKPEWQIKPEWLIWRTNNAPYIPRFTIATGSFIRADLVFHYDYYYPRQRSRLRIVDAQNMIKFTVDTIARKLGFNDLLVKQGSWDSRHSETGGTVKVTLTEIINEDNDEH